MKVIELMEISAEILLKLKSSGVKVDDCRFVGLYNEYMSMRQAGEKATWVASVLADKYGVSVRQVYYLIKRFDAECMQS